MKWFVLPFLLSSFLVAQESLPDAPSSSVRECSRPIVDFDNNISYMPIPCSEVPAYTPKTWEQYKGHSARYFTFRGMSTNPPLRTNRQAFDKVALTQYGVMWAAIGADMAVNRGGSAPKGADFWVDPIIPGVVVTGACYVMDRFFTRPMCTGLIGYVTFIHARGVITKKYP